MRHGTRMSESRHIQMPIYGHRRHELPDSRARSLIHSLTHSPGTLRVTNDDAFTAYTTFGGLVNYGSPRVYLFMITLSMMHPAVSRIGICHYKDDDSLSPFFTCVCVCVRPCIEY